MTKFTQKTLAFLVAIMLMMTITALPTMAENDPLNAERILGSYTTYDYAQFIADFEAAENKAVLTFEDGSYTALGANKPIDTGLGLGTAVNGGSVPITNCSTTPLYILCNNGSGRGYSLADVGTTGTKAHGIWTGWNTKAHFIFGYSNAAGNDTTIISTDATSLRPTVVGFIVSSNTYTANETLRIWAKYTDGTTVSEEDNILGGDKAIEKNLGEKGYFVGIKAPVGKFIHNISIQTGSAAYIDDICVIMEDPADFDANKTTKVEVTGDTVIEQPAYNTVTKATYTAVAKDENENELEPLIQWELVGDYYGDDVSIDENGVLTVTRDFDTAKKINLIAYVHNELTGNDIKSDPLEITVNAVDPYLRSDRYLGDVTSYTRAKFLEDFNSAEHKAVLNFEDGNYTPSYPCWQNSGTNLYNWYGGAIQGFNVPITNVANTELNIYWKGFQTTSAYLPLSNKFLNTATSGKNSISVWNNGVSYFVFGYENLAGNAATLVTSQDTTLRPTAVGFMFSHGTSTQYSLSDVKVKYTDGSSEDINADNIVDIINAPTLDLNTGNNGYFLGFKAPAGKFIQHIQFYSGSGASYVDDICVILEDPAEADLSLSTDALGYTEISALSDIGTSTNITASMPKNGVAGSKLFLAIYGENNRLIDVDFADANPESGIVTANVSRGEEQVKAIKAFIWNSMAELIPLDGGKFILN